VARFGDEPIFPGPQADAAHNLVSTHSNRDLKEAAEINEGLAGLADGHLTMGTARQNDSLRSDVNLASMIFKQSPPRKLARRRLMCLY